MESQGRFYINIELYNIDGDKLFNALRKMPIDGIVFNCSGPIKPKAFPLGFCDEVLSKG